MKTLKQTLTIIAISLTLINCGELPQDIEYTGVTENADVILANCGSQYADPDNCFEPEAFTQETISTDNCDEKPTRDGELKSCERTIVYIN